MISDYCDTLLSIPGSATQFYTNLQCQDILGDVNGDSLINVQDIIVVINLILSGDFNLDADINLDSTVNVADIILIVNIILN